MEKREQKKQKERGQRSGAMIFKIAIGLLFIVVSFLYVPVKEYAHMATGWILGGAFIAWAILPYREELRRRKAEEKAQDERILNTPLERFGEIDPFGPNPEELAKKYEKN